MKKQRATAFAPATIGNVAVGFDVLGLAVDAVGDRITVTRTAQAGQVEIKKITGCDDLPLAAEKNTATAGLIFLARDQRLPFGFSVEIKKGIPLGSGMGGSAASAVGAIVAANALLDKPLTKSELFKYALVGEAVASGSLHGDNVAPCLFGGLTLVHGADSPEVVSLSFPSGVCCVLVHPHFRLDTRVARAVLKPEVSLKDFVHQSANLALFVAGCEKKNRALIQKSLQDLVIEPQRRHLIPGFESVKEAALTAGAMGCSISGAGPSLFALAAGVASARKIKTAMVRAFEAAGLAPVQAWIAPVNKKGAVLL